MQNCVHFCQSCLNALSQEKEASQYYDYFCNIHACVDQAVVLTEPLDDQEKYCINLLETRGYLVSTEINGGSLAILPMRREYNNVFFYCASRKCESVK